MFQGGANRTVFRNKANARKLFDGKGCSLFEALHTIAPPIGARRLLLLRTYEGTGIFITEAQITFSPRYCAIYFSFS